MKYPSVTEVLRPFTDPLLAAVPPHVLEQASARGRDVHRIVCAMARGVWFMAVPQDCRGYVDSWQGWSDKYVEKILLCEPELVNQRLRFKGHPDLLCIMKGDRQASVVEFKTPKMVRDSWRLQLSAYRNLVEEDKGLEVSRSFSLRLHPEGKPPIVNEFTGTMAADFNVFLGMLNAWHFFNPNGGA